MNRFVILLFILLIVFAVKGIEVAYAELPFVAVVKATDESVTSLDVPQNDDELLFGCSAGKVYAIELSIFFTTPANGDYSNQWSLPTGATGVWTRDQLQGSSTSLTLDIENQFDHNAGIGTENFTYRGFIKMGTTSGTCTYQWSQDTIDAGATTTLAGSSLKVYETTPNTLTIPHTTVTKRVDEIIQSIAVPQNDDELSFACNANKDYLVELYVFLDSPSGQAFATQWSLPTGATGRMSAGQHTSGGTSENTQDITVEDTQSTNGLDQLLTFYGTVNVGSTAGVCQFQWSQDVSGAFDTTVFAGSTLTVYEEGTTVASAIAPFTLIHTKIVKLVDESIFDTEVLQDDDELFFTCEANKVYSFEMTLIGDIDGSNDLKSIWIVPSGTTVFTTDLDMNPDIFLDMVSWTAPDFVSSTSTATEQLMRMRAIVNVGSTGGTCQWQWAMNSDFGTNTATIKAGSTLLVYEEGTAVASLIAGAKGDKGDKGDTGSAGARGADGQAGAGAPVGNPVSDPDAITQADFDLLLADALAELQTVDANIVESAIQTFFEFSVIDVTHDQLVLNSFLGNERLGIRWSSGQDMIVTSAVPASSPFLITFEQFPSVKRGSGAVISTDFILYNLEIPNNPCTAQITSNCVQDVRYAIPVTVNGIVNGVEVTDTGIITIDLTEQAFDPILLLILAMFFIPAGGILIQKLRGRSGKVPVNQLLK